MNLRLSKMLRIFAKINTDEKIAVWCMKSQTGQILNRLNEEYGADWIPVDELMTGGEILKFKDGLIYKGFEVDKKRYCDAIKRFKLNKN